VSVETRILGPGDEAMLTRVAPDVFDNEVDPRLTAEFLHDPRHHLAVAVEANVIVGFASGVHYVHPDKPPELWINEVGVAPSHQRRGVGRLLLSALFKVGHSLGCREAWALTEESNTAAKRLYESVGGSEPADGAPAMFIFHLDSEEHRQDLG
jgi:ribosomal protein S18 acetylase RimI-like enzyme